MYIQACRLEFGIFCLLFMKSVLFFSFRGEGRGGEGRVLLLQRTELDVSFDGHILASLWWIWCDGNTVDLRLVA